MVWTSHNNYPTNLKLSDDYHIVMCTCILTNIFALEGLPPCQFVNFCYRKQSCFSFHSLCELTGNTTLVINESHEEWRICDSLDELYSRVSTAYAHIYLWCLWCYSLSINLNSVQYSDSLPTLKLEIRVIWTQASRLERGRSLHTTLSYTCIDFTLLFITYLILLKMRHFPFQCRVINA